MKDKFNRIFRTLILLVSACCAASSCINDEAPQQDGNNGGIVVSFSVGGGRSNNIAGAAGAKAPATRATATEPGNDALNENTVSRLDLFVFNNDGSLAEHRNLVANDAVEGYSYDKDKHEGLWTIRGLNRPDVEGKTVYLTANWDKADEVKSLGNLQSAKIEGFTTPNVLQADFLMDGKSDKQAYNDQKDWIVHVDIARALSKIRLTVKDKDGKDITAADDVAYRLLHYSTTATVIAGQQDSIPDVTELKSLPEDADFNYGDGMYKGSSAQILKDNGRAVFYTCPNNWWNGKTDPYKEEPVDEDRQTAILLKAPYTDASGTTTEGFYKIPVNSRLPENGDEDIKDENEWKPVLSALYNISRNTIYNVTVKIDRPGGDIEKPVDLKIEYVVDDWTNVTNPDIEFE